MREERGRTKGFDDTRFRAAVEILSPQLSLDALRQSITTRCIDRLGNTWEERYGQLIAFKERFGHCKVPIGWEEDAAFSAWVNSVRAKFGKGLLSREQIQQLNAIDFSWSARAQSRPEKVSRLVNFLKKYKEKYGDCNVPVDFEENPRLGKWVAYIRTQKRKGRGRLPGSVIGALDAIGFVWDYKGPVASEAWFEMLEKLRRFKKRFGHCNVGTYGEDIPLGRWAVSQRGRRKKGALSEGQIRFLDELGFVWAYQKVKAIETWRKWYRELEAYAREHGDPHVPRTYSNKRLASWVWTQRQRRKGTLKSKGETYDPMTPEQECLLNKLGFLWRLKEL